MRSYELSALGSADDELSAKAIFFALVDLREREFFVQASCSNNSSIRNSDAVLERATTMFAVALLFVADDCDLIAHFYLPKFVAVELIMA